MLSQMPAEQLPIPVCATCRKPQESDYMYNDDAVHGQDKWHCEACFADEIEKIKKRARAYAVRYCKITSKLPKYNPDKRDAPTPEEYAAGDREGHTENSVYAEARHKCTNYDALLQRKAADRECYRCCLYYEAIRDRIEELLEEGFECMEYDSDEDEGEDED
jgi:hypothetical protein